MAETIKDWANDAVSIAGRDVRGIAYTYLAPSDEPLTWDTSGLVRLDVAIYAARLAAARFVVRSFPTLVQLRVERSIRAAVEGVALGIGGFFVAAAAKKMFFVLKQLYSIWQASKLEEEMERSLRSAYLRTMRDLLKHKMKPKGGQRRVTKRVASRHTTR